MARKNYNKSTPLRTFRGSDKKKEGRIFLFAKKNTKKKGKLFLFLFSLSFALSRYNKPMCMTVTKFMSAKNSAPHYRRKVFFCGWGKENSLKFNQESFCEKMGK
jgi:hypothetical protein